VVAVSLIVLGLLAGGLYGLASLGLTLTYGVLRIVNFAHGEFIMVGMYSAFWLQQLFGLDPYLSLPITTVLVMLLSAVVYFLVIRPTIKKAHAVQAFVTLGLSLVMSNLALVFWTGQVRSVNSFVGGGALTFGEISIGFTYLVSFVVAMMVAAGLWFWIQRTDYGKAIRATIQNPEVAGLMGIDVNKVYFWTFVIGTGLAGFAGGLFAPIYPIYPDVGLYLVLIAFVVVVLGGMGSIPGAIAGGLMIGVIEALSGFYIGVDSRQLVYFLVFVAVLVVRPTGLFGIKGSQELGYR
jgi:branched-chain amino acid transport system permease protein